MILAAYIPNLQELALVKISILLWSQENLREYLRQEPNGHVCTEKALVIIKKSTGVLGLPLKLKNLLTDMLERVGYEIHSFMTQSVLNFSETESFSRKFHLSVTAADLNLSKDLQWTSGGEISFQNTLISFMENHPQASPLLFFISACETGSENLVLKVWEYLSEKQKLVLGSKLSWTENNVFLAYWTCFCQGCLDEYFKIYESQDFVIDSRGSMYHYLVLRSMSTCFKCRTNYFYSKLTKSEKKIFIESIDISSRKPVLLGRAKYSFRFFEAPIQNYNLNKIILETLTEDEFEYLTDYFLSKINSFGNLHTNVLLYLMSEAPEEIKLWTLRDPDFYFFLISNGRFDTAKILLTDEIKLSVREEITAALDSSEISALMESALGSEYFHEFLDIIADRDEDPLKIRLKSRLSTLKNESS